MFLIVTRGGETRRIEIPTDVERAGTADAWAATCDLELWEKAEVVPPTWPLPADDAPLVPAPIAAVASPAPAPAPFILDEE